MIVTDEKTIEDLKEGGRRLSIILGKVCEIVKEGVTTDDLNRLAEKLIKDSGDTPSFLNYKPSGSKNPYPATLCISINDEIVHGVPSGRVLKSGDIIGLDIGLIYKGVYLDMAVTVFVGEISDEVKSLMETTKNALYKGIYETKIGNTIGDISSAIEKASGKYGIVRELGGHGVGGAVHESPFIPNFGKAGSGEKIQKGMVLALEPMLALGNAHIMQKDDGFTYATKDGSLSAHFEHTILVTDDEPLILTKE